jgi:disulfide bond formation protein DsbB
MAKVSYWLNRSSLYIALMTAWVAMLGSLYFSEVKGYVPCELCWYQRILMYPLAGVIAVGLLTRDRHLPKYVLPLSTLGLFVAFYHYLLEKTDLFDSFAVCSAGVSCTTMWINWFGFVTIPFLSLLGFTIITIMSVVALLAGEPSEEEERVDDEGNVTVVARTGRAWLPVAAIVGAVLLVFGVTFSNGWQATAQAQAAAAQAHAAAAAFDTSAVSGSMVTVDGQTIETGPLPSAGELYFREACAACHGQNAEGVANLGNTLAPNEFVASLNDAELLAFIRAGRDLNSPDNTTGLVMPPSGGRPDLSDDEIFAVIEYLRSKQP